MVAAAATATAAAAAPALLGCRSICNSCLHVRVVPQGGAEAAHSSSSRGSATQQRPAQGEEAQQQREELVRSVLVSGCGRLLLSACHMPLLVIRCSLASRCTRILEHPALLVNSLLCCCPSLTAPAARRSGATCCTGCRQPRQPLPITQLAGMQAAAARRVAALPVAHRLPPSCSCWLRHLCGSRKCGWPYGGRAASWACLQRRWVLRAGGMVGGPPWMQ